MNPVRNLPQSNISNFGQSVYFVKPWPKKTKWSFLANEYLCKFLTGFLIIFLLTVFLPLTGFATGTEITYPSIPAEAATPTATTSFPAYVKYLVGFAMGISGFIAFGVMVWGGILYLTSAGDINQVGEAKRKIFGALLGLIIILGSYVILVTINPQLTGMSLQEVKPTSGIYFKKQPTTNCLEKPEDCYYVSNDAQKIELPDNLDGHIKAVEFISPTSSLLAVYVYNDEDFKGTVERKVNRGTGSTSTISFSPDSPKSIYFLWNRPGVYLCPATISPSDIFTDIFGATTTICSQRPLYTASSISDLSDYKFGDKTYNDIIKSIQFIHSDERLYAAILFENPNYESDNRCPYVWFNDIPDLNSTAPTGWPGSNDPPILQDTLSSIVVFYYEWERQISGTITFYDTTECPGSGKSFEKEISPVLALDYFIYHSYDGGNWDKKVRSFMISGTGGVLLTTQAAGPAGHCKFFTRQGGEGYKVDSRGCITRLPTEICDPNNPDTCPSTFIIFPLPE